MRFPTEGNRGSRSELDPPWISASCAGRKGGHGLGRAAGHECSLRRFAIYLSFQLFLELWSQLPVDISMQVYYKVEPDPKWKRLINHTYYGFWDKNGHVRGYLAVQPNGTIEVYQKGKQNPTLELSIDKLLAYPSS